MLPVRHLFDNRPLAEAMAANWAPDAEGLFEWYRLSSNAVYPFRSGGAPRILRFAPAAEKAAGNIRAELDFLRYLGAAGYPALQPVPAADGRTLVEQATPWGDYLAVAFTRLPGRMLGDSGFGDEVIRGCGRMLGRLHLLSSRYRPVGERRWSHRDVLDWIGRKLAALPDTGAAREEVALLREHFHGLPADATTYGLIHYDFEPDNVLFDAPTGRFGVIDFDDAMYHWYAVDVEQALDSLLGEVPDESAASASALFLAGYAEERPVPADLAEMRPAARRFADLYWYARARHSLAETLADEPGWLADLRRRIGGQLPARMAAFGRSLF